MNYQTVYKVYNQITNVLIERKQTITCMESATSGLIASLLTDTEGASAIMKGAYVTYSNEAKIKIGVAEEIIDQYGVYSRETAAAMAKVARKEYNSDYSISVTGTMGNPDPANPEGVPGQVYYAISCDSYTKDFYSEIPPMESRFEYKLYVAKLVAKELLEILSR